MAVKSLGIRKLKIILLESASEEPSKMARKFTLTAPVSITNAINSATKETAKINFKRRPIPTSKFDTI